MIRQCAWCGLFLGEVAPFERVAITHGICPRCYDAQAKRFALCGTRYTTSMPKETDQMLLDHLQPRIVQIGRIKIGSRSEREYLTNEAKQQGMDLAQARAAGKTFSPPEKHDYFTIRTMDLDDRGRPVRDDVLMAELIEKYGDADGKLRTVPVYLLSNDIESVLQSTLCWYSGRCLGARADLTFTDGKLVPGPVTWFNDPTSGKRLAEPRTDAWDDAFLGRKNSRGDQLLKVHTYLNCTVASQSTRFGGVYRFRTGAQITTSQLYGGVMNVLEITGGVLTGLPFLLRLRPQRVSPDGKPSTVYVVHIELHGSDLQAIQDRALHQVQFLNQMQRYVGATKRMLAAPGYESDPAEVADIQEEFQPENIVPMPRAVEPAAEPEPEPQPV